MNEPEKKQNKRATFMWGEREREREIPNMENGKKYVCHQENLKPNDVLSIHSFFRKASKKLPHKFNYKTKLKGKQQQAYNTYHQIFFV